MVGCFFSYFFIFAIFVILLFLKFYSDEHPEEECMLHFIYKIYRKNIIYCTLQELKEEEKFKE